MEKSTKSDVFLRRACGTVRKSYRESFTIGRG